MSKTGVKFEHAEVRLHNTGGVDELLIYDPEKNVVFHMEQMSKSQYWMRVDSTPHMPNHKDIVINIGIEDDPKFGTRLVGHLELEDPSHGYIRVRTDEPHPLDLSKKTDQLVKNYGMTRVLMGLIANVQTAIEGELQLGHPNDYLRRLKADLEGTLQTYEDRNKDQENGLDC